MAFLFTVVQCPQTLHFDFLARAHRVLALRNRDHPVDKTGFYYDMELELIGYIYILS